MDKKNLAPSQAKLVEMGREQQGQRIDNFLIKTLKQLPKTRIYRLIRKGEVRVNKKRIKPEYKLQIGDVVRIPPIRAEVSDVENVSIPDSLLRSVRDSVLFENESIVILNKPSGLAVHSGSGVRFGVIDIMRQLHPDIAIELVHRLDRDTSGCLILAKHREALLSMQNLLRSDDMQKRYTAIVKGKWPGDVKRITQPLKRVTMPNGEKKVFVEPDGQSAETLIESTNSVFRDDLNFSVLQILLKTGRTHQIRVHCQSLGHEIGGDDKYGDREFNKQLKSVGIKRLLLHASQLDLPQTAHTQALKLFAPLPAEFDQLINHAE